MTRPDPEPPVWVPVAFILLGVSVVVVLAGLSWLAVTLGL